MTPPPTPWMARAPISTPASFAIPQPSDAAVNTTSPTRRCAAAEEVGERPGREHGAASASA